MKTCLEKMKLFEVYQEWTHAHSEAIERLQQTIGTSSKEDYDVLYRMAEALRMEAAQAQKELNDHVAKHRC
jgi:hypothetical protein